MKPVSLAILLAVIVGFGAFFYFQIKQDQAILENVDAAGRTACPDHWHTGYDVYYQDSGSIHRVDWVAPLWPGTSYHYYEYGNPTGYKAPGMSIASHIHMDPSGKESAPFNQIHYEKPGSCIPIKDALKAIDVGLSSNGLSLSGGLPHKSFTANATAGIHVWTRDLLDVWTERDYSYAASTQVKDGESFLVAFGDFTAAQVKQMQDNVHEASSHDGRLAKLQASMSSSSSSASSSHA